MVTAATPAFSNSRAKNGAERLSSSQPRRIFTVTGSRTASTTVRTSFTVPPASHIMAEPPPPRVTL